MAAAAPPQTRPEEPAPTGSAPSRPSTPSRPVAPAGRRGEGELLPRRSRWLWPRRLFLAALLSLSIAYLPYRLYMQSGLQRFLSLQGELSALQRQNQQLRQENRRLYGELERLRSDDGAVERVAREELGLVRPGELVFRVAERAAP